MDKPHISLEGKLGISLGLIALAGAGALVVAHEPLLTLIGWLCIIIAALGGAALACYHFWERGARLGTILVFLGTGLLISGGAIGLIGAFMMDTVKSFDDGTKEESVPGLSVHVVIRINDLAEAGRKYIYEMVTTENAKAMFYIFASDRFTFSVIDVHGEAYPLEVAFGGGIPINRLIFCHPN